MFSGATSHTNNSFQYLFRKSPNLQQFATICFGFPKKIIPYWCVPLAIGAGRSLSRLTPALAMTIASSLEIAAKTSGGSMDKIISLLHPIYRQACGKEQFQPFLQNQYSMFLCIGWSQSYHQQHNYYNMLVIRCTSPGTSYLRIICFLRWIWLDWWTILQRNRCLHYCAVKSVWLKNILLKLFYFDVKLLNHIKQLPINQIRCPSHYNSESPEALLCNEHMIQVVWYRFEKCLMETRSHDGNIWI